MSHRSPPRLRRWSLPRRIAVAGIGAVLLVATAGSRSNRPGLRRRFPARSHVQNWLAPLRIANSYGLFAVMTTERPEITVEGSDDGETWRPYRFRWKPGELDRRPRFAPLHLPRLDWQMWFAASGAIAWVNTGFFASRIGSWKALPRSWPCFAAESLSRPCLPGIFGLAWMSISSRPGDRRTGGGPPRWGSTVFLARWARE